MFHNKKKVVKLGQFSFFLLFLNLSYIYQIFFLSKLNFLKDIFIITLYLHLIYFIMQNYPVTREWDEADWLDPLL